MPSPLKKATRLIRHGQFALAREMLQYESGNQRALYLLSLLYRYDDDYERELETVTRSLDMDGNSAYMRERLAWHNLPFLNRVVPRRALDLPRDPDATPTQEMLDQLCIVTTGGSDEPFRQLLIELLESLAATRLYKDTPVYIFDAGISDEDRQFLLTRFKQIRGIRDPGWDVDVGELKDGYKATTARIFMNKHFPGHRYYLWIDTDCWVQNELAIDELILLAHEQGLGICPDAVPSREFYSMIPAPARYKDAAFLQAPPATDALFCIDAATPTFDEFQRVFLELYAFGGFTHFLGQFVINVLMRRDGRELKQTDLQRVLYNISVNVLAGCPVLDESNRILNTRKELVGFPHLTWHTKVFSPYCRPFLRSSSAALSVEYANEIETLFWKDELEAREDVTYASVCYRTWPWADKPQLVRLLTDETAWSAHDSGGGLPDV